MYSEKLWKMLGTSKTSNIKPIYVHINERGHNKREQKLVWRPNNLTTNSLLRNFLPTELCKTNVQMNEHAYLGRSILDISKIAICAYLYHYIKRKYEVNAKIRYMETDNFFFPNYLYSFYRNFCNNTNSILVINKK